MEFPGQEEKKNEVGIEDVVGSGVEGVVEIVGVVEIEIEDGQGWMEVPRREKEGDQVLCERLPEAEREEDEQRRR